MAERSQRDRGGLLGLRLLEFIFAVILVGIFSWFHSQMKRAGYFSYYVSDVPLGFSVAALVLTVLASFSHLFLHNDANTLIAILDSFLFIGYFASCIVYRQNFHVSCYKNVLVRVFATIGSPHCGTVRTGAALLVLQTILFFATTILSFALARRHQVVNNATGVHEEKSRFGFGRRNRGQPAPAQAVGTTV
ncbi:hypothetical protein AOL_s00080g150 [Orbilia oligospora ATCC 24927]|uniref:MARVEL domain-containing protein n=2 Tax=Orbilia oligospora TaxID=2813651 RepID=G1XEB5_ARTOA|nr:hypothetical protein AOL_s00080g150 [Orbilia oligospora ATCC 24927]EGX48521.1 hypothetical protein AOL_s00080g150 [Orbilia oligospora ATCC 24927]KAF3277092.1 hypothetical protein TWF970_005957 [Orbilia oligospora]